MFFIFLDYICIFFCLFFLLHINSLFLAGGRIYKLIYIYISKKKKEAPGTLGKNRKAFPKKSF